MPPETAPHSDDGVRAVREPTYGDVERAIKVISTYLEPTPVVPSSRLGDVFLKLDTLQPTGSYKVRGAFSALSSLSPGARVVVASAGNHGLGIAYAAQRCSIEATIVVPETASAAKVAALREFPATLVQHGDRYEAAEAYALQLAADGGARYISPYNDPGVIAGQATMAAELFGQMNGPFTIVSPLGGGGLVSGMGLWASMHPDVRIIGVECDAKTPLRAALDAGHRVEVEVRPTIADGLGGNIEKGSITFDMVRRYVDDVVVATEAQIEDAIRFLAAHHGLIAEGAAAVALAAILGGVVKTEGRMVALVTGRNITMPRFAEVLARGA